MLTTIMTIINICSLTLIAVGYFREHYAIVDLETWNTVVTYYNENAEAEQDNCGGGIGFYMPTDEECLYSEDEEDARIGNNRKIGF